MFGLTLIILQADNDNPGPRTDRANSASRGGKAIGGGMGMMEEMARKLAARCVSCYPYPFVYFSSRNPYTPFGRSLPNKYSPF